MATVDSTTDLKEIDNTKDQQTEVNEDVVMDIHDPEMINIVGYIMSKL